MRNDNPMNPRRVACILVLLLYAIAPALAITPQEIAKRAFPSTVLIIVNDSSGQPLSLGSGFYVARGLIATNLHVLQGGANGYVKTVGQSKTYPMQGICAIDTQNDLALIAISGTIQQGLTIGNSDSVEIGEPVYAVGNPQGLEGTFSQGIVSSIRVLANGKLLQITAPISPGSSGGPVFNSKGEVIGVSVATFSEGQNLNFAVPSNYLRSLIKNAGSPKSFAEAKIEGINQSTVSSIGDTKIKDVYGSNLTYDSYAEMGDYSFSIVNKLPVSIRNVICLVVFYDDQGNPIDVQPINYSGIIPAGLAKRITGQVDSSVERLNRDHSTTLPPHYPKGKIDFRVLDFEILK